MLTVGFPISIKSETFGQIIEDDKETIAAMIVIAPELKKL